MSNYSCQCLPFGHIQHLLFLTNPVALSLMSQCNRNLKYLYWWDLIQVFSLFNGVRNLKVKLGHSGYFSPSSLLA